MRLIGITGGIGSGKTLISKLMKEHHGAYIIIADEVGHRLSRIGGACYRNIVAYFGETILLDNKEINRSKLASLVFSNQLELDKLNQMTHPIIYDAILDEINSLSKQDIPYLVVEAAAFIEADYMRLTDELWYVYADPVVRQERLIQHRGYSVDKIQEIFSRQLPDEVFRKHADYVIDNSYDIANTSDQINQILNDFKKYK